LISLPVFDFVSNAKGPVSRAFFSLLFLAALFREERGGEHSPLQKD
jgi:hypothetical protein